MRTVYMHKVKDVYNKAVVMRLLEIGTKLCRCDMSEWKRPFLWCVYSVCISALLFLDAMRGHESLNAKQSVIRFSEFSFRKGVSTQKFWGKPQHSNLYASNKGNTRNWTVLWYLLCKCAMVKYVLKKTLVNVIQLLKFVNQACHQPPCNLWNKRKVHVHRYVYSS